MAQPNEINRIFIDDNLTITTLTNTLFAFNSGEIIPKGTYSLVDKIINVTEQILDTLSVYYFRGDTNYFEYRIILTTNPSGNVIKGTDKNGKTLKGLTTCTPLIFVNGTKLSSEEYHIDSDTQVTIYTPISNENYNTIIIYCCPTITYCGRVTTSQNWDSEKQTFIIPDTSLDRYAFFLNGRLIARNSLEFNATGTIKFNVKINSRIDILEYYRFPENTICLTFEAELGHFGYGPRDLYNTEVPTLFDAIATFDTHIARLAIDDLRFGFFIREVDSDGCLMIVDDTFETYSVNCLVISPFEKTTLTNTEFYIQVPEARSILYYASEFDLSQRLFPELLGTFQKLLLNETYDSIQRIRNLRNINKIDSKYINSLIEFLGFKQQLINMKLEQKHALLEELNNFYKTVGTRSSYNFYNIISKDSKITDIQQLFTPIRDNSEASEWEPSTLYIQGRSTIVTHGGYFYFCNETHTSALTWDEDKTYWTKTDTDATARRYVTFYTAEELGAQYKHRYEFPYTDYGEIGQLANTTDILSNEPHSVGMLTNKYRFVSLPRYNEVYPIISQTGDWWIHINTAGSERTEPEEELRVVTPNKFISGFRVGPNTASEDYDYGYISDFEYFLDLSDGHTLVEGRDSRNNALDDLNPTLTTVFVNGKPLPSDEYTILSSKVILITGKYLPLQTVYINAYTFTTIDDTDSDYDPYYFVDALNEENNNCYTITGDKAMGIGIYSNYQIKWRRVGTHIEYYFQTSSTTTKVIGTGTRAALLDQYIHTDNISCPYSAIKQAFTGDVSYRHEYDVTDWNVILSDDEQNIILTGYHGTDTEVTMPTTTKINKTWYINPEEIDPAITKTNHEVAYHVYDENNNRIYYGINQAPVIGKWAVDTNIIQFIVFDENNNEIVLGSCTRNSEKDIKIDREVNNLTQVDIWCAGQIPTNSYDYGYVWETIKGEWIEWFEWDRPSDWYPTNHVSVALEIPPYANYDTFINEFKKTFYDIASTVLYIHNIINVYKFGYGKNNFGMLSAPTYHTISVALTNNPNRQPTLQTP